MNNSNLIDQILKDVRESDHKISVKNFFENDIKIYTDSLDQLSTQANLVNKFDQNIYKNFLSYTNSLIAKGEELTALIDDKVLVRKIKQNFRLVLKKIYLHGTYLTTCL